MVYQTGVYVCLMPIPCSLGRWVSSLSLSPSALSRAEEGGKGAT